MDDHDHDHNHNHNYDDNSSPSSLLCDELLIEIFQRLPTLSLSTVSLVSKRWLRLSRHSTTSLSLRFHHHNNHHITTLLNHYPFLITLSLCSSATFNHPLLAAVATSCRRLRHLRILLGTVSSPLSLSPLSTHLTSLTISVSRPFNLFWVPSFHSLKDLSLFISTDSNQIGNWVSDDFDGFDSQLNLESFSVSGLRNDDVGMGWFWWNLTKLRRLYLRNCDGVGDGGSYSLFLKCLTRLTDVELRSCRSISDMVLLKIAEFSIDLGSILVYDGGSRDGLLYFINNCKSNLQKLDLRLPLDLENQHLCCMGLSFRKLSCLRLQSCCLVTGDGLKTFSLSLSNNLEELALINCDVVERVPGLLTTLGQNLKKLRYLDLSYNEMLVDKELVSMLISCTCLVDLKLRGCKRLTNMTLMSIVRICKNLEKLDIVNCGGIGAQAVDFFLFHSSSRIRRVQVELHKLSKDARRWATNRSIDVTS